MNASPDGGADAEARLQAIVSWLEHGRITTEQAAARVKAIPFPPGEPPTVHAQQYGDLNGDPKVPQPGSFFAVSDAFAAGRIDQEQYAALAQAAVQAMSSRAARR